MKPASVNILGKNYKIKYAEDGYKVGPDCYELLWGYVDHMKREITVHDNNHKEDVFETMLHEILHAVGDILGVEILRGGNDESESLVNLLAVSLSDILIRNRWITLEEEIEVELGELGE